MRRRLIAIVAAAACGEVKSTPDATSAAPDADPTAPDADPTAPDADPAAPDAGPPPDGGSSRYVFVTSQGHDGDFNGLAGADQLCNQLAAPLLPGTYLAWLSDGSLQGSPRARMTHFAGPYVLPNGLMIASSWNDLVDGQLLRAIDVTESGGPPPIVAACTPSGGEVWSATAADGNPETAYGNCQGWQSRQGGGGIGSIYGTNSEWTDYPCPAVGTTCTQLRPIYCFQQ